MPIVDKKAAENKQRQSGQQEKEGEMLSSVWSIARKRVCLSCFENGFGVVCY